MIHDIVDITGNSTPNSNSYKYAVEDPNGNTATFTGGIDGEFNFTFQPNIPGIYKVQSWFYWDEEVVYVEKKFMAVAQTPTQTEHVRIVYPDGICVVAPATVVKATSTANIYGVSFELRPFLHPDNILDAENISNPGPPSYLYAKHTIISTPGTYIIVAKAYTNGWSNFVEADLATFCVKAPPTCVIYLSNDKMLIGNTISAAIVATDTDGGIVETDITMDGSSSTCSSTICGILNFTPTSTGIYTVFGTAVDTDGIVRTCSATFEVLPLPPVYVKIVYPTPATTCYTDPRIIVQATSTSNVDEVKIFLYVFPSGTEITRSGPITNGGSNEYIWDTRVSTPGTYLVYIEAYDQSANPQLVDTDTSTFCLKAIPKCHISTSATEIRINHPITATLTATDVDGNVVEIRINVDSMESICNNSTICSLTFVPTLTGMWTFTGIATDNDGYSTMCLATFSAVTLKPPMCNIRLSATEVRVGDSIIATLTATDVDSDLGGHIVVMSINVASTSQTCNGTRCDLTFIPTKAGVFEFTGIATDDDGLFTLCRATLTAVSTPVIGATIVTQSNLATISCCEHATAIWNVRDATEVYVKLEYKNKDQTLNEQTLNSSFAGTLTFHPNYGPATLTICATDLYDDIRECKVATIKVLDNTVPYLELELVGIYSTHTIPPSLVYLSMCTSSQFDEYLKASDCSIATLSYQFDDPVNGLVSDERMITETWISSRIQLYNDGVYNATLVATDIAGNVAKLFATIIIDQTSPEVDINLASDTLCGTTNNIATYTATDSNFVYGFIEIIGGSYSRLIYIPFATESATLLVQASSGEFDRTVFTVGLVALDCAENVSVKTATFVVDTKFGFVNLNPPDYVTTETMLVGTLTDLSSICVATVTSTVTWSASEVVGTSNPTLTFEATILGGWQANCDATEVTLIATVKPVAHIEGKIEIALKATDCCCGSLLCTSCGNSTFSVYEIIVDSMPPTETSTPTLYLSDPQEYQGNPVDSLRVEYNENVGNTCHPIATITYHYVSGIGTATSDNYEIPFNNPRAIVWYFSESSIPDNIDKATVTYKGVCDLYGNEVSVSKQPVTLIGTNTTPVPGR